MLCGADEAKKVFMHLCCATLPVILPQLPRRDAHEESLQWAFVHGRVSAMTANSASRRMMTNLCELDTILSAATHSSLVLIDELARGASPHHSDPPAHATGKRIAGVHHIPQPTSYLPRSLWLAQCSWWRICTSCYSTRAASWTLCLADSTTSATHLDSALPRNSTRRGLRRCSLTPFSWNQYGHRSCMEDGWAAAACIERFHRTLC